MLIASSCLNEECSSQMEWNLDPQFPSIHLSSVRSEMFSTAWSDVFLNVFQLAIRNVFHSLVRCLLNVFQRVVRNVFHRLVKCFLECFPACDQKCFQQLGQMFFLMFSSVRSEMFSTTWSDVFFKCFPACGHKCFPPLDVFEMLFSVGGAQ